MTSWCDKLASTPTVGVFLDPDYTPVDQILAAISPRLNSWHIDDKAPFSVSYKAPFNLTIQHDDGFIYSFEPTKASVAFQHRMKLRQRSAGPPVAELLSRPEPFTALLRVASQALLDFCMLLPNAGKRTLMQVGVVSQTFVDRDDMPPGISAFLDYMGRPWPDRVTEYNVTIISTILESDTHLDKCIHSVNQSPEDDLYNLVFDYQAHQKGGVRLTSQVLRREIESTTARALDYLEKLAVGSMFDGGDSATT